MDRKELARQVFLLGRRELYEVPKSKIWQAIAETNDDALLSEYERLCDKYYVKVEQGK